MKPTLSSMLALVCLALAGCGATPMLHVGNAVFNLGQELPDAMRDRNLAAVVAYDEDFVGRYDRVSKNVLYVNGVVEGSPEYLYRVARINLHHSEGGMLSKPGKLVFMTGAMVPDNLPALKAGDVVEVRQTGTWRTMEGFAASGEGNIVLRMLCAKNDPAYLQCLEKLPRIGDFLGQGPTGTLYPEHATSLGLKFTPAYAADGTRFAR